MGESLRWPRDILYPLKLALTSTTSGGRSVARYSSLANWSHGVFLYRIFRIKLNYYLYLLMILINCREIRYSLRVITLVGLKWLLDILPDISGKFWWIIMHGTCLMWLLLCINAFEIEVFEGQYKLKLYFDLYLRNLNLFTIFDKIWRMYLQF
jgi:hypothetical protein